MAGAVLSAEEREEIRVGCAGGESFALMARTLGRSTSTVSEEVRRNGGRHRYCAVAAEKRAVKQRCRPVGEVSFRNQWARRSASPSTNPFGIPRSNHGRLFRKQSHFDRCGLGGVGRCVMLSGEILCGCSSMVEPLPSKQITRVRSPSPALYIRPGRPGFLPRLPSRPGRNATFYRASIARAIGTTGASEASPARASARARSRSSVACWYLSAAAVLACPARLISSAVVAPVAADQVSPECRRSWKYRSGRPVLRRALS